jgi:anti-sigma B factor antagonist
MTPITASMTPFDLSLESVGDLVLVRPVGHLSSEAAARIRKAVDPAANAGGVVVDLSRADYVDSVGLGALIGLIHRVRADGGVTALAAPPRSLEQTLRTTGCDRIAVITASVEEAIRSLTTHWPSRRRR